MAPDRMQLRGIAVAAAAGGDGKAAETTADAATTYMDGTVNSACSIDSSAGPTSTQGKEGRRSSEKSVRQNEASLPSGGGDGAGKERRRRNRGGDDAVGFRGVGSSGASGRKKEGAALTWASADSTTGRCDILVGLLLFLLVVVVVLLLLYLLLLLLMVVMLLLMLLSFILLLLVVAMLLSLFPTLLLLLLALVLMLPLLPLLLLLLSVDDGNFVAVDAIAAVACCCCCCRNYCRCWCCCFRCCRYWYFC